jgi:hypothetical protein
MTKVTCLGDSIRIQYTPVVRTLLGEEFEVYAPNENCRYAKHTLRGLYDWKDAMQGSRIVHWNNGLWDICDLFGDGPFASVEEYVSNMLRIADILLSRHDTVIFATTTPVDQYNRHENNADIEKYNAALVPELIKKGVLINDLYPLLAADIPRYIRNDHIHLTDEGIDLCAQRAAEMIREAAKNLPERETAAQKENAPELGAPIIWSEQK